VKSALAEKITPKRSRRATVQILPCTPVAQTIAYLVKNRARLDELAVIAVEEGEIRLYTTSGSPLATVGLLEGLKLRILADVMPSDVSGASA